MNTAPVLAAAVIGMATVAGPAMLVRSESLEAQVPVRLVLDQSRYAPGAEGHVRVQIGKDGYLLVLYAQPDGHVDVAYPLDPGVSDQVEADSEIEVLTRGGTSAFTVEDSSGSGAWYAAISSKPFRLRSIAVNGHWDYRVIPRIESSANTESELTSFVEGVSGGRFDYDIVSFVIDSTAARTSSSADRPPAAGSPPPAVAPPPAPPPAAPWAIPGPWIAAPWGWAWGWGWGGGVPWAGPYLNRTTAAGAVAFAPYAAPGAATVGPSASEEGAKEQAAKEHAAKAPPPDPHPSASAPHPSGGAPPHESGGGAHESGGGSHASGGGSHASGSGGGSHLFVGGRGGR